MLIPYSEVLKQRKLNDNRQWCEFDAAGRAVDNAHTARDRLLSNAFAKITNKPKFFIDRGASIYTIGSCFARNVEHALLINGFRVPTAEFQFDQTIYVAKPHFQNTVLNKYNPHSMASEIMRGLGRLDFPDHGLLEVEPGVWFDPQTSHTRTMSKGAALSLRHQLDNISFEISKADLIVLTLGLTETWLDTASKIVFNSINPGAIRPIHNRVHFHNVNFPECLSTLREAFLALYEVNPAVKIIITVSPVPMTQTFTDMDVISANSLSKATLRSVAGALAAEFDYVDYFPSYEMVINSPREISWLDDQIHVQPRIVNKVISEFVERYVVGQ